MELWTAFMLGLGGSLHCAGMCGPLLLALPVGPGGKGRQMVRRVVYHAGRLMTYAGLGAVMGLAGHAVGLAHVQRWVSLAAGALIILGLLAWPARVSQGLAARPVGWLKVAFARLLGVPSLRAQLALGAVNGLLPCGLVYVAAAASTGTGGLVRGCGYMVVFGLGTLPMLLVLGMAGRMMHGWLQPRLRLLVPACLGIMAGLLILRGLSLGIPYLSPDLSSAEPGCCAPGAQAPRPADHPGR